MYAVGPPNPETKLNLGEKVPNNLTIIKGIDGSRWTPFRAVHLYQQL